MTTGTLVLVVVAALYQVDMQADRSCQPLPVLTFPGSCLIHHATVTHIQISSYILHILSKCWKRNFENVA